MFTGLIERTGILVARKMNGNEGKLTVRLNAPLEAPEPGESIAVNGTCLTLEKASGTELVFHVMAETFSRTNLGTLPYGAVLNLECALRLGDRLGGHFVSGHVDGTGRILSFIREGSDMVLRVELPDAIAPFLVPKGSIALDGISLTIAELGEHEFCIKIIPTTWNETNLKFRSPGDELNLEADMLGKQVRFQLDNMLKQQTITPKKVLTMDDLRNAGF